MIDGLFDISIDTPKYHRRGTLVLKSAGEGIVAKLKVSDLDEMTFEGTCADKEFDFAGTADLPSIGEGEYKAHGSTWGNSLDIACETVAVKVTIFGTRLGSSAGSTKSSHDYMMSGSIGDILSTDGSMYSGLYADGG